MWTLLFERLNSPFYRCVITCLLPRLIDSRTSSGGGASFKTKTYAVITLIRWKRVGSGIHQTTLTYRGAWTCEVLLYFTAVPAAYGLLIKVVFWRHASAFERMTSHNDVTCHGAISTTTFEYTYTYVIWRIWFLFAERAIWMKDIMFWLHGINSCIKLILR